MTLRDYLRNPPVRWATEAEVLREYGMSRAAWLSAWRTMDTPAFKRRLAEARAEAEALRKKGKAAA